MDQTQGRLACGCDLSDVPFLVPKPDGHHLQRFLEMGNSFFNS